MIENLVLMALGVAAWECGRWIGRRWVDPWADRLYIRFRAWNAFHGWAARS